MGTESEATVAVSLRECVPYFRRGEFLELLRLARPSLGQPLNIEPNTRVVIAHALALTGDLQAAVALAELDSTPQSNPATSSHANAVLGIVNQVNGDVEGAQARFQTAIRLAGESGDQERVAWAHLHLYRLLVEGHPMDALASMLVDVRRVVTRIGDPQITAYLHSCVSVLEGQTGRLEEALRHCDIADSLLTLEPNVWISCGVLQNRACIACLGGRYQIAAQCIAEARKLARSEEHTSELQSH